MDAQPSSFSGPGLLHRVAPEFIAACLPGVNLKFLDQEKYPVFGLTTDLTLAFLNQGWFEFARANDGEEMLRSWDIGRSLFDAIPPPLAEFYRHAYTRVTATGVPWEHRYECSSATERRWFTMRVLPAGKGGFLVVNGLASAEPITDQTVGALLEDYRQPDDLLVQCSHCRRVRRTGTAEIWDFVPEVIAHRPAMASHGLCGVCLAYHYPAPAEHDDDAAAG